MAFPRIVRYSSLDYSVLVALQLVIMSSPVDTHQQVLWSGGVNDLGTSMKP